MTTDLQMCEYLLQLCYMFVMHQLSMLSSMWLHTVSNKEFPSFVKLKKAAI